MDKSLKFGGHKVSFANSGRFVLCKGCIVFTEDIKKYKRSSDRIARVGYKYPNEQEPVRIHKRPDGLFQIECLTDTEENLNKLIREASKKQLLYKKQENKEQWEIQQKLKN